MRKCSRCGRVLRSREAAMVGMGAVCCRKATGKTIKQVIKETDAEAAKRADANAGE